MVNLVATMNYFKRKKHIYIFINKIKTTYLLSISKISFAFQ